MPGTSTNGQKPRPSARVRAILGAVAAGGVEMSLSCEPDLFIDGLCCCDQFTAHALARAGLIAAGGPAALGTRVKATLTPAGAAALGSVSAAPDAA